ncbi:multi-sensor hybrid histidine kinase [Stanieria cyanosphaera PCC 7437]|uniref:histidine kinase n=1 Tax=Stanieria cyanosphaera (strain ATCC 29371 / PCC 7437) TaxID=111780 RepID=K9XT60_STAC7|nr:response regulator [Stanieria cyanosphaera]AFZ35266.1 multi-sensor hybrid histidine kinase [Stanieria cyanosphaera PCC 7437]
MSTVSSDQSVILIVDDTPTNLEILLDLLENSGFKVVVSEEGESAIEMAEYAPPDLILLDILMPEMDGFETCRRLKMKPTTKDIPIIFMTALSDRVDRVKGLNLGAVDYITKPLEHEEVLARVNIHLRLQNLTKRLTEQNAHLQQEIEKRKQAQAEKEQAFQALQQSEARFRRLVESNIIGIICSHLNGKITEANDAFLKIVGYDRNALQMGSLSWHEMTPSEYQHLDQAAIAQLLKSGVCNPFEKEFICQNGTRVPVMLGSALLEGSQTAVSFVLDLTEHKQAQQKIFEQAALLDITTDAILVRDLDNKIRFWNQGAERLYGWKASEAIGKNANELLYREQAIINQLPDIQASLTENGSWQDELHQVTKSNQEIIVSSRWTLVRDDEGQPKSLLVVNTDITEKKQLEMQFFRAQRLESLGTLASGIAHDFNNILTPMLAVSQLLPLKLPDLDEQSKNLLKILETSARRGAALVKQILSFAREEEGRKHRVQVRHLLSEVAQIAQQTFPKSIEVIKDVPSQNLWTVWADATQLHQVLMNLCINARDAMPNGGTLTIAAENIFLDEHYAKIDLDAQVGSYIVISIVDTGTGIRPEILERIFEPFFTTKELGQGTGLGLSTVLGIIKSHGGFLKVYSELGEGTQFKVYLPASEDPQIKQTENFNLPKGHGELILVVDDELAIREITKTLLKKYNYNVITAKDGIEAIAFYAQHQDQIAVVLMDMMMPAMDGSSTIRALRKINPQLKIIATSGLASNEKLTENADVRITTFLPKPYTAKDLLESLEKLI